MQARVQATTAAPPAAPNRRGTVVQLLSSGEELITRHDGEVEVKTKPGRFLSAEDAFD